MGREREMVRVRERDGAEADGRAEGRVGDFSGLGFLGRDGRMGDCVDPILFIDWHCWVGGIRKRTGE